MSHVHTSSLTDIVFFAQFELGIFDQ